MESNATLLDDDLVETRDHKVGHTITIYHRHHHHRIVARGGDELTTKCVFVTVSDEQAEMNENAILGKAMKMQRQIVVVLPLSTL